MGLTEEEKRTLIDIAKTTIDCRIAGRSIPEFRVDTEALHRVYRCEKTPLQDSRADGCCCCL